MAVSQKKTVENDSYELFMSALDVVNSTLKENKDHAIIGNVVSLAQKALQGRQLGVAVYADDADTPHDYFTLRFTNGRLELLARGKDSPDIAWKVSQDYLRDLVENEDDYIANPAKLDLDWLRDRAGI